MMIMHSMELDDEDKMDAMMPIAMPSKPDYPYGLQICLTEAEFKKLDLDPSQAVVGGIVHLHAMARITSVSSRGDEAGKTSRVEMQIESLAIESEDDENKESR